METRPVREGEELNIAALREYLRNELGIWEEEIAVEQFPAGSSNLTYLVRLDDEEFVLRRPPFGNTVKTAHDMAREFNVLSRLGKVYAQAPKPLIYCGDESVIGSEFFLMERRHGIVIRGQVAEARASVKPIHNDRDTAKRVGSPHVSKGSTLGLGVLRHSQEARLALCGAFIHNLADLHKIDIWDSNLADLGKPEGYNRRQVEGWTARYSASQTHEWPELAEAIEWVNERVPNEFGASMIHNDYKFDNIMLDPTDLTKVTAVLDWEMATVGDPLMDLGTTLGYWMSRDSPSELLAMPFNPGVLMRNVSRRQLIEMYEEALGLGLPDMLFYYVFGTFKIAVIAQQIYARYAKGFTRDERFAKFHHFVAALGRIAGDSIARDNV